MPEEIALIRRRISIGNESSIGQRNFVEGHWQGVPIVLAHSRVGKVSAAMTTLLLIERFAVGGIIFTGVAGALDPDLRIGDIVIADRLVQHDMDASPLFPRFEIPLLGLSEFPAGLCESARIAALDYLEGDFRRDIPARHAAAFGIRAPRVRQGLVVSGDQFVSDPVRRDAIRGVLPDALCVEMEGAAVAQACFELGKTPCAIVRIISDDAGHSAAVDFQRFLEEVAEHVTGGIALRLVQRLSGDVPAP